MKFKTKQAWNRYQGLQMRNEAFQAVRKQQEIVPKEQVSEKNLEPQEALILMPENRRVFSWEWMAEQSIEGRGESIYDQLQAVLDAEHLTHLQDWTLLRPGLSTVLTRWDAPQSTYLGNFPRAGTLNLRGSTFTHNVFHKLSFRDVDLRGSALVQCYFKDCDLRGLRLLSETPCHIERCTFVNCWLPREFEMAFDPMLFQRPGVRLHRDKDQAFLMPGASTR